MNNLGSFSWLTTFKPEEMPPCKILRKENNEQWKLSKIIPVHKKGDKSELSNYRPIANLCAVTKIFERLILQRIQEIEDEQNVDITGTNQHGFKRGRSTTTAGLAIQSALARALDEGQYK